MNIPPVVLEELGWRPFFAAAFQSLPEAGEAVPGRVVLQQRGRYTVMTGAGEVAAELASRLRKQALAAADLPCVGDWVAVRSAGGPGGIDSITAVLPRLTKFSRKTAGVEPVEQILAANVDVLFLAMGLDGDFNVRRLERYLTVGWASGARPVVLLTKADLCAPAELAEQLAAVAAVSAGAAVVPLAMTPANPESAEPGTNISGAEALTPFLGSGQTIVLLGSSGVGKSTLVNALLQRDALRTGRVRPSDSRGRHTTTQRQLFRLESGALVIDTPGIRELQLWDADSGFGESFSEIDAIAGACRFRDCRHGREPGCAVRAAQERGEIPAERMASYAKLKSEQAAAAHRSDPEEIRKRKRAAVSVTKLLRHKNKER